MSGADITATRLGSILALALALGPAGCHNTKGTAEPKPAAADDDGDSGGDSTGLTVEFAEPEPDELYDDERSDRAAMLEALPPWPGASTIGALNLPVPVRTQHQSGLTSMVLVDDRAPVVHVSLTIRSDTEVSLAPLAAAVVAEVANTRLRAPELGDDMEFLVRVDNGATSIWTETSSDRTTPALAALAHALRSPKLDAAAWSTVQQHDAIRSRSLNDDAELARRLAARLVLGQDSATTIEAPTLDRATGWLADHATADRLLVVLAGDVDADVATRAIDRQFRQVAPRDNASNHAAATSAASGTALASTPVHIIDVPARHEAHVLVVIAPPNASWLEQAMLAELLDERAQRLRRPLDDDHRHAWARPTAGYRGDPRAGFVALEGRSRVGTSGSLAEAMLRLVADVASSPLEDRAVARAGQRVIGRFAREFDTPGAPPWYPVATWQYGLPDDYWRHFGTHVQSVGARQLDGVLGRANSVATNVFVIAVGSRRDLAPQMAQIGTMTVHREELENEHSGSGVRP